MEKELKKYLKELNRLFKFYVAMDNEKDARKVIEEIRVTKNKIGEFEPDYSAAGGSN